VEFDRRLLRGGGFSGGLLGISKLQTTTMARTRTCGREKRGSVSMASRRRKGSSGALTGRRDGIVAGARRSDHGRQSDQVRRSDSRGEERTL
jgi:hypothetical protein